MIIKLVRNSKGNAKNLMRRCGYKPWYDPDKREEGYIRRFGAAFYPRFHAFGRFDASGSLSIDLHLDARRPMHRQGVRCFEDEESEVVQKETSRIKQVLGEK